LEITFGRTKDYMAEKAGLKDLNLLTEADKEAVLFIQKNGGVTTGDFAAHFNINLKAAQRKLNNLVIMEFLDKEGTKRGTRFSVK